MIKDMTTETNLIILVIFACVLASLSVYLAIKTRKKVLEAEDFYLNTLDEALKEVLEPINLKISKSYSQLGTMGATVKQQKALDRRIAQDVIDMQNPLLKGILDMFPNAKEYIEKNPDLLMEAIPRLQALQGIEGGFSPMDLISPPSSLSKPNSHPFGYNEE